MISIKKYMVFYFSTWFFIFLSCLILTLVYYYDLINDKTFSVFLVSGMLISIFINSFFLGKKSSKKGYWEGIKFGLFLIVPFILYSLILKKFYYRLFLYYFLILFAAIAGSILGINKKKLN